MELNKVVIHYSEIAIKGGNRKHFENLLMKNIQKAVGKFMNGGEQRYGKIILNIKDLDESGKGELISSLQKVPGIVSFCIGVSASLDFESIKERVLALVKQAGDFGTFRISTKRGNKKFSMSSPQINEELGGLILDNFGSSRVKLKGADLEVFVEIGELEAHIYTSSEKYLGVGGLPVGSGGRVVVSLSGGLDSPVAAYMVMKRGLEVVYVHVHNSTVGGGRVKDKIKELTKILSSYQPLKSKLYIIPFDKLQQEVIMNVPSALRMIVYRRIMMRLLNEVAVKVKASGIVTGDSFGQVASQTLENQLCIRDASILPVFSPLIGMNKEEIIRVARDIGTFDTSILPGEDCCSFMIAKNPETKAKLAEIKKHEDKITNMDSLVEQAIKESEIIHI